MTIASHFPIVSPAHASATLRALALVPGQTVEGRVLGPGMGGATLVQVGRQTLSLSLPGSTAQVGTILTLAVQQAEGQLRLTLLASQWPEVANLAQQPATSVEISHRPAAPQGPLTYAPPTAAAPAGPAGGAVAGPVVGSGIAGGAASASPSPEAGGGLPGLSGLGAVSAVNPAVAVGNVAGAVMQRTGAAPYGTGNTALPPHSAPPPAATLPGPPPSAQGAALAQMVQHALPGQASIGAVTGMLAAALGQVALPEPVLKAARQILGNRLIADGGKVDATALKSAIRSSGLFQEAMLARGAGSSAAADTKSGLLALQQGLAQWLGGQTPISQVSQIPPPLRHVLPRARVPETVQPDMPGEAEEVGRMLLERTEGALSRLRLHQHASLPDAHRAAESQWSLDLPVVFGGAQAVIQLQIHHDGGNESSASEDRGWQVRFAVNLPELGEVGAQVSLRGQHTGILLWADREETAQQFSGAIADLRASLEQAGLMPGALVVRHGAPSDPQAQPNPGHVVDAMR